MVRSAVVIMALVSSVLLFTCSMPPRTWKRPVVAEELKRRGICLEEVQFYLDDRFTKPSKEDSLSISVRQEARRGIEEKLAEVGFSVRQCSIAENQLHLYVDAGVRSCLVRFFIVIRVLVYKCPMHQPADCPVCELFAEVEIFSDKEEEVRRVGNLLTDKIAADLKAVVGPSY